MKKWFKIALVVANCIILLLLITTELLQSTWILGPKDVFRTRGRLYVIGTGPAGPQMATVQAIKTIEDMDVIIAPDKHAMLFRKHIRGKPVLFNPWEGFFDYQGKRYYELNQEELSQFEVECFRLRDERVAKIKQLLEEGKNVGLLDSGNPFVFGPSHWYIEQFEPEDLVIIPGMGSAAAGLAALGKSIIPAHKTRFIAQTAPFFLADPQEDDVQILRDLKRYDASMVYYMALEQHQKLFGSLREVFPADMPCAVVYWAGFPVIQRVVSGTVGDMEQKLARESETYMGILFVGRFLEGKPYESAMRESLLKLSRPER